MCTWMIRCVGVMSDLVETVVLNCVLKMANPVK